MIKKVFSVLLIIILIFSICGCDTIKSSTYDEAPKRYEQPHLYWKDIIVEVKHISRTCSYRAYAHHYHIEIEVYNEKYNLTDRLNYTAINAYPIGWELKEGDKVTAILYSYKIDSTGEITSRSIHSLADNYHSLRED